MGINIAPLIKYAIYAILVFVVYKVVDSRLEHHYADPVRQSLGEVIKREQGRAKVAEDANASLQQRLASIDLKVAEARGSIDAYKEAADKASRIGADKIAQATKAAVEAQGLISNLRQEAATVTKGDFDEQCRKAASTLDDLARFKRMRDDERAKAGQ